jgi:hypothetical protein
MDYIRGELLLLIPVLNILGKILKDSLKVKSEMIPLYLGIAGVVFSTIWVLATTPTFGGWRDVLMAVFVAVTQGLLCAGAAVYGNQILKQERKRRLKNKNLEDN